MKLVPFLLHLVMGPVTVSLESRPSPFRDRFTHAHINGRVYGKIRRGKERAWDTCTSPESWVMYSDVIVFVVSLPCLLACSISKVGRAILHLSYVNNG